MISDAGRDGCPTIELERDEIAGCGSNVEAGDDADALVEANGRERNWLPVAAANAGYLLDRSGRGGDAAPACPAATGAE